MVLATTAQFRGRDPQFTLRTIAEYVVVLADALMPPVADIGISVTGIKRIVSDIDFTPLDFAVAKGAAPVIEIVDFDAAAGMHFRFAFGRGRQRQEAKLFFVVNQPMSARSALNDSGDECFARIDGFRDQAMITLRHLRIADQVVYEPRFRSPE